MWGSIPGNPVDIGALPLDQYSITLSDGCSLIGTPLTGSIQLH